MLDVGAGAQKWRFERAQAQSAKKRRAPTEKAQAAPTVRLKVPMRRTGGGLLRSSDEAGNARGAKGAGHRTLDSVNRQWEEPINHRRRQPSRGGTSRMNRE